MNMIVGIDEVGRGPLAGPVTLCAVSCSSQMYTRLCKNKHLPPLGKDSKKLSQKERETYARVLKDLSHEGFIYYFICHISHAVIDTKGISFAIKTATARSLGTLKVDPKKSIILLDGGLKAPSDFKKQKTIIKGDEKEKIIAWASILAKVSRDNLMTRLSKKFPQYEFDQHKGYGTSKHREKIRLHGLSSVHRKSFCKKFCV